MRTFWTTSKHTGDHLSGEFQDKYSSSTFSNSTLPPADDAQWESLLDRGLAYDIKTRAQLCQEADVGDMSQIGTRLTDNPKYRHDIELWEILLIAQALQNGHEGIKAIWRGMKFRGEAFRLDRGDPRMDALYKIFLSAGSEDLRFLWALCKEAKQLNYRRPHLFAEFVGAALESPWPLEAGQFASFIGRKHYKGDEDLLATFFAACRSQNADALQAFRRIYDIVPKACIYSEVTSALWEQDRAGDAFRMHSFLVSRRDLPPHFKSIEPFINHLALHNEDLETFLSPLYSVGVSFGAQAKRLWSMDRSRLTGVPSDSLNIVASKTMGTTPSKLSDQFVARAFATRAFSFDFAIHSLRMIGLIEVGPLSVRQLGMASADLATLRARFQTLRELEIDTGASVFVRVLRNVCEAGHWEIVQALVDNDLHHEAFEDTTLQRRLLTEYYRKQDWRQLNRTLAILTGGLFDEESKRQSAVLMLLAAVNTADWTSVVNRATSLQEHGWAIPPALPRALSPLSKTTGGPMFANHDLDVDQTAFAIGMMQKALAGSTIIDPRFWRRALRGLGRRGRLDQLESLAYWIAEWYQHDGLNERVLVVPTTRERAKWKKLFDAKFQKSLMSWCFRRQKGLPVRWTERAIRCMQWTCILKRLRDAYGIPVEEHTIRWEFIKRLRRLFAPGMRLKGTNAIMRRHNRLSLSGYWTLYDKMWDMNPRGPVKYDDRIQICLYARRLSRAKRRRLREYWWRSLAAQRLRKSTIKQREQNNVPGDIVVYRDLFNASWVDYRK